MAVQSVIGSEHAAPEPPIANVQYAPEVLTRFWQNNRLVASLVAAVPVAVYELHAPVT